MAQKIDPRVLQLLKDAVASGKYTQCRDFLRKGNEYCISGVLCDLYMQEKGTDIICWSENPYTRVYELLYAIPDSTVITTTNTICQLPEILDWANLSISNADAIQCMNDGVSVYPRLSNYSFNDIIAWLEKPE